MNLLMSLNGSLNHFYQLKVRTWLLNLSSVLQLLLEDSFKRWTKLQIIFTLGLNDTLSRFWRQCYRTQTRKMFSLPLRVHVMKGFSSALNRPPWSARPYASTRGRHTCRIPSAGLGKHPGGVFPPPGSTTHTSSLSSSVSAQSIWRKQLW